MFRLGVFLVFVPQIFWFADYEPGQAAGRGHAEFQRPAASVALDDRSSPVRGVVVTVARDVEPLRGARISLTQDGTTVGDLFSDSRGRFELPVRDPANYTLQVSKAGFAPALIEGSSIEPRDPLVIRLHKGAVITGRVTDVLGEPVLGASVRVRPTDSDARPTAAGPTEFIAPTDDQGGYRVGSLPAGRYEAFLVSSGVVSPNARLTWSMLPSPAPSPPVILDLTTGEERAVHFTYQRSSRSTQPSNPGRPASRGSGSIAGRILTPAKRPVEGAVVRGLGGTESMLVRTDAAGRYELSGLPPGRFRIEAHAAGFLPTEYGQEHGGGPGRTVVVSANQRVESADVIMQRGGVITGLVNDVYGEPLEGILVQVWTLGYSGGRPSVAPNPEVPGRRTDDRGRYRIPNMRPGTHFVAAIDASASPATSSGAASLRMMIDQAAVLQELPPVFYPGSASIAEASPVVLHMGADATGVDIAFRPTDGARVHGVVLDSAGRPASATVNLTVSQRSGAPALRNRSTAAAADGSFEMRNVPPGEYVLRASTTPALMALPSRAQPGSREFGMEFVTVADEPVGPLVVMTAPASTVTGTIVIEGHDDHRDVNLRLSSFAVSVVSADIDRSPPAESPAQVKEDGTFTLVNLAGPLRFVLSQAPPGWWLKSALIDGQNAAEDPVTFATPGEIRAGVNIIVSSRGGAVAGRALDERRDPADDYSVVVFSQDRRQWYSRSRSTAIARSDVEGRFMIDALPPGDYFAVAIDQRSSAGTSSDQWYSAGALDRLVPLAQRLTLREGHLAELELPLRRVW